MEPHCSIYLRRVLFLLRDWDVGHSCQLAVLHHSEIHGSLDRRQRAVDSADREVLQRAEFVWERQQLSLVRADLGVEDKHPAGESCLTGR